MKKNFESLYEKLGGTYREENGHFIPDIALPEQTTYEIGKYGHLHLDFIKKHRRGTYTTLMTEGRLNEHLHTIDEQAHQQIELHIKQMAKQMEIKEELKASDPMRWVRLMNNIKSLAEEIVLKEVVYK